VATASMESIQPLAREVTSAEAVEHLVASKTWMVKLNLFEGRLDVALRAAEEGLAADPTNKELLDLKKRVEEAISRQRIEKGIQKPDPMKRESIPLDPLGWST